MMQCIFATYDSRITYNYAKTLVYFIQKSLFSTIILHKMCPPGLPLFFIHAYFVLLQFLKIQRGKNDFPAFPSHLFSQTFFVLTCIIRVLDSKPNNVIDRLGLTGIAEPSGGRDYFHYAASFPIKFWYLTGETVQTFGEVVVDLRMPIILLDRANRRNRVRHRIRVQRLNVTNRLLLVFIWLRRYLRLQTLAMMFKVDITYASKTLREILRSSSTWEIFTTSSLADISRVERLGGALEKIPVLCWNCRRNNSSNMETISKAGNVLLRWQKETLYVESTYRYSRWDDSSLFGCVSNTTVLSY